MENNILFYAHNPLGERHLKNNLRSLFEFQIDDAQWDNIFIYNSGTIFTTPELIDRIRSHTKNNFSYKNIIEIPYKDVKKTLTADLKNVSKYFFDKPNSKLLIYKIDYSVSSTFHSVVNQIESENLNKDFLMTLPTCNAKELTTDDEIFQLLSKGTFEYNYPDVYFRCGDVFGRTVEYGVPLDEARPNIKFVSCTVVFDFNCHYLTTNCLKSFLNLDDNILWAGTQLAFSKLANDGILLIDGRNCFAVHTFHEIKLPSNNNNRADGRKLIPSHRY